MKKGRAGTKTHDYERNGTSSSWLNLVERFFALITNKAIRRGVFSSVKSMEEKLLQFIARLNENPKPFVWIKSVEVSLEKEASYGGTDLIRLKLTLH